MSAQNETPQGGNLEGSKPNISICSDKKNLSQNQQLCNMANESSLLERILPATGLLCVATKLDPPKQGFAHRFCQSAIEAEQVIKALDAEGKTVYIAQASYTTPQSRKGENACRVKSFWFDIDCGPEKYATSPDESYPTQRYGMDALRDFIGIVGLPMPTIVSSGNGLYAHWILTEEVLPDQWKGVATILKKLCDVLGFKADRSRTADIASVLRPVGSTNRKYGEKPVQLAKEFPAVEFASFATTIHQAAKQHKIDATVLAPPAHSDLNSEFASGLEGPPSSGFRVAEHCAQIRRFRDLLGNISEPEWYAGIGVLRHTEEGEELIQAWSSGHPDYNPEDTEAKIAQHKMPPTTCHHFKNINPSGCEGCEHFDKIKSPISLGYGEREDIPEYVTTLNAEYFVARDGSKTIVFHETYDPALKRALLIRTSFADFKNFHNNRLVITGTDGRGNPKFTLLGNAWLGHPNRRQYKGIVMSPGGETIEYYNLWRGCAVKPVNGSWKLMLQHLNEVICDKNAIAFNYLICWLARMFQHPEKRAEVAIVLQGGRGAGKGMFGNAICRIVNAGVDSHIDDPLGGVLTTEQMARRDRIVFEVARGIGVPVCVSLAGGYQVKEDGSIDAVLRLHGTTFMIASNDYSH